MHNNHIKSPNVMKEIRKNGMGDHNQIMGEKVNVIKT
jgi:hypothetical protein